MSSQPLHHIHPDVSNSFGSDNTFVCIAMAVDELSHMSSETEKAQYQTDFANSGRKSWKTLRGKHEAVWPPILETCLIEALKVYDPNGFLKNPSILKKRFPMRNKFIADYIFDKTGKRRTAKQVGSRLQQLRDTCKHKKIRDLLPYAPSSKYASSNDSSPSPCSTPNTMLLSSCSLNESFPIAKDPLYVDIILDLKAWPTQTPSIDFSNEGVSIPQSIHLASLPGFSSKAFCHNPSALSFLSGEIQYISQSTLNLQTTFMVYAGTAAEPIHTEHALLDYMFSASDRSEHHYSTILVPEFWATLCSNPTQYTIHQSIKSLRIENGTSFSKSDTDIIKIIYKLTSIAHGVSHTTHQNVEHSFGSSYALHTTRFDKLDPDIFTIQSASTSPSQSTTDVVDIQESANQVHDLRIGWTYNPDTGLPVETAAFLM